MHFGLDLRLLGSRIKLYGWTKSDNYSSMCDDAFEVKQLAYGHKISKIKVLN